MPAKKEKNEEESEVDSSENEDTKDEEESEDNDEGEDNEEEEDDDEKKKGEEESNNKIKVNSAVQSDKKAETTPSAKKEEKKEEEEDDDEDDDESTSFLSKNKAGKGKGKDDDDEDEEDEEDGEDNNEDDEEDSSEEEDEEHEEEEINTMVSSLKEAVKKNNTSAIKKIYEDYGDLVLHDLVSRDMPYSEMKPLIEAVLKIEDTLAYNDIDVSCMTERWDRITPLGSACKNARWDVAEGLLNDFNARVTYGFGWYAEVPLHHLCMAENPDGSGYSFDFLTDEQKRFHLAQQKIARLMLAKGALPDLSCEQGYFCLLEACKNEYYELACILISEGNADVTITDSSRNTALHLAMRWGDRDTWECTNEMKKLIDLLIHSGADINAKNVDGFTPLMFACTWSHFDSSSYLLENYKPNAAYSEISKNTALHLSANTVYFWDEGRFFKLICQRMPTPFKPNLDGITPLLFALRSRNTPLALLLLQQNGGVTMDIDYNCCLKNDDDNDDEEEGARLWPMYSTAVLVAICSGNIPKVEKAIQDEKKNGQDEMKLYYDRQLKDCEEGEYFTSEPYLTYMKERGVTPDEMRKAISTPTFITTKLHLAVQYGHVRIVQMLLEKYGEMKNLNTPDWQGYSPLHQACKLKKEAVGIFLIEKGANALQLTKDGKKPLHLAVENNLVDLSFAIMQKTGDLRPIVEQGFTIVQACDALCKKYVEWCIEQTKPPQGNGLYTDPQFYGDNAIFKDPSKKGEPVDFDVPTSWKRIRDLPVITREPQLIVGTLDVDDIEEGGVGTCFFLGSLAVLTTQPELILDMFVAWDVKLGIYGIRFNEKGKWVFVIIDDLVACGGQKNLPIYAWSKDRHELYVLLLEKAYAKVKGCYENINGGIARYSMVDMTGGVCKQLKFYKGEGMELIRNRSLFKLLYNGFNIDRKLMSCQIENPNSESEHKREDGLLENHAYGILSIIKSHGQKLLKINNPHGHGKWKGKWADNSQEWIDHPKVKEELNPEFIDNGVFYMCYEDFIHSFNAVDITSIVRQVKSTSSVHVTSFDDLNLLNVLQNKPQEIICVKAKTAPVRLTVEFSQAGFSFDEFAGREIMLLFLEWPSIDLEDDILKAEENIHVVKINGDLRTAQVVAKINPTFDTRVAVSLNLWEKDYPYFVFPMLRYPELELKDLEADPKAQKKIPCTITFYSDMADVEYKKAVFSTEMDLFHLPAKNNKDNKDNKENKNNNTATNGVQGDEKRDLPKSEKVQGRSEVSRVHGRNEVARVRGRNENARVRSKGKSRDEDPSLPGPTTSSKEENKTDVKNDTKDNGKNNNDTKNSEKSKPEVSTITNNTTTEVKSTSKNEKLESKVETNGSDKSEKYEKKEKLESSKSEPVVSNSTSKPNEIVMAAVIQDFENQIKKLQYELANKNFALDTKSKELEIVRQQLSSVSVSPSPTKPTFTASYNNPYPQPRPILPSKKAEAPPPSTTTYPNPAVSAQSTGRFTSGMSIRRVPQAPPSSVVKLPSLSNPPNSNQRATWKH